jgi:hypothetical protein
MKSSGEMQNFVGVHPAKSGRVETESKDRMILVSKEDLNRS